MKKKHKTSFFKKGYLSFNFFFETQYFKIFLDTTQFIINYLLSIDHIKYIYILY